jgi:hypothetical protein
MLIRCTSAIEGWVAWALVRPMRLYGEDIKATTTYNQKDATDVEEGKVQEVIEYLERVNKCIKLKAEQCVNPLLSGNQ